MTTSTPCNCSVFCQTEAVKNFSLSISESISNISETEWNKHIPEANSLMQYDELKLIEEIHSGKMQFRYAFAKKDDAVVGAMYFQVVMFHANQLMNYFPASNNFLMRGIKFFSEKLLSRINLKLLVSGNVFMTGENGFYFRHDIDKIERAKILRKTADEILKNDSAIKAVLISDLYAPKTEFDSSFKQKGYNELFVESDMHIRLRDEWKTFDDYMQAFSSKYRIRAKRVFALCEQNNIAGKELSLEEIEQHEARLYELYQKVMANADFKLAELNKNFFSAQKKTLPENYRVFAYFKDETIVGFISIFYLGKKIEVHYTGMDADIAKPTHLYQHMMYDMVKFGIENRTQQLHFGRTAPEIKSTIGATPSPMYGHLKHRNPLFNFFVVQPYTANLKPKNYVFRNPFRN